MRCTQVHESREPPASTWHDNYVCVRPTSILELAYSSNGPIAGRTCDALAEPEDPSTWDDNYLCYSP